MDAALSRGLGTPWDTSWLILLQRMFSFLRVVFAFQTKTLCISNEDLVRFLLALVLSWALAYGSAEFQQFEISSAVVVPGYRRRVWT